MALRRCRAMAPSADAVAADPSNRHPSRTSCSARHTGADDVLQTRCRTSRDSRRSSSSALPARRAAASRAPSSADPAAPLPRAGGDPQAAVAGRARTRAAPGRNRRRRPRRPRERAPRDGRRVRRVLRHQLLGALLAGEGTRAGAQRWRIAPRRAGVAHVIWSTLEDTREFVPLAGGRMPVLMGKYNVPHFDAKGEANRAFTDRGVPTTLLYTSFYWDNLIHFGMQPGAARTAGSRSCCPWATRGSRHRGRRHRPCAFGIFARGEELVGKSVGIAGEHLTGAQMAAQLWRCARRAGRARRDFARAVPRARLSRRRRPRQHVPVQARLRAQLLRVAQRRLRSRAESRVCMTFAAWLAQNKSRLPIA